MVTMDVYGKLFDTEHDKVADALDAIFERHAELAPAATVTQIAASEFAESG